MADRLLHVAQALGERALAVARRFGSDVAFAAVDKGGHLIFLARHDLCAYPPVEVARRKAATAACLRIPTHMLAREALHDPISAAALAASPDMLAVPGGFPLILDGLCQGGVGLAGGSYVEDLMFMEKAMAEMLEAGQTEGQAQ